MKKKKISLSSIIKKLRIELRSEYLSRCNAWEKVHKLQKYIDEIQKFLPGSYFKITFKAKCKDGQIREFSKTEYSCHARALDIKYSQNYENYEFITIEKIT